MAGLSFPCLLPLALLVVLGRPLDTSSRPVGDTGTSTVLAKALEQRDVGQGTTLSGHMKLLFWSCGALDLLAAGVYLSWWLCRRLRRRWGQEKHQSPSASAGTGCQGHACCKDLLQLLRDNRALMRLCLRHGPLQRPGEKRPRK